MKDYIQKRLAEMERRYLELEAVSLFQAQAVGILLALVEDGAYGDARRIPPNLIRSFYERSLREETEKFLQTAADDAPNLASRLRDILQCQLDRKPPA